MSRNEKPQKRNASAPTQDRSDKRMKKVKADHHRPKYKHLIFATDERF